jgi:hypothetical protein
MKTTHKDHSHTPNILSYEVVVSIGKTTTFFYHLPILSSHHEKIYVALHEIVF